MNKLKSIRIKNQQGLVSLIVTVIIMFVLTITVIGFASFMRREQRQTLDRQLNTQAFYAAESGINDAIAKLNTLPSTSPYLQPPFAPYTKCTGGTSFVSKVPGINPNLDSSGTNKYTCLLVDPAPPSLEYIIDDKPRIIPVVAPTPTKIDNITISWQAKDANTNFNCPGAGTAPALVPKASWVSGACATGLIRMDLVPVDSVTRDDLNNNIRTLFLYPRNTAGAPAVQAVASAAGSATGILVQANCQSPAATPASTKFCGVKIGVSSFNSGSFYLRMTSLYLPSAVTITADNGGTNQKLSGAQAVIDSTGKANDVLRRIQVHVSLNPLGKGPFPGAALQSADSICKRLAVIPPPAASADVVSQPFGIDPTGACAIN